MIKPNQIKAHRKSLGLTQEAYAAKYGVSRGLVRMHWETNGIPDKDVKKAQAVYDVTAFIQEAK